MKRLAWASALFCTLALVAIPVAGQDLTGTWTINTSTPRGSQTMTFELVQDGASLTGSVTVAMAMGRRGGGGGGMGSRTIEISEGSVEGGDFSFSMTMSMREMSMTQHFRGTVEGDSMEGTIEGGRGGSRPFTGQRDD